MSIEEKVEDLSSKVDKVREDDKTIYDSLPGCGTLILAIAAAFGGVSSCYYARETNRLLESVYSVKSENVRDGPEKEKFYDLNGKRIFLEIDGIPVDYSDK